ncbi:CBP4-domain-containing protein [Lineolata rhizophorae]|uniref:Cytochrome b mRNA-processing protein 4 n=1 Tax=Lineolata rhizophorae TaxID=578093 RepID=A0A6A6NNW4_9PEZI|nr:CBP4-domain-containing protein [Lineolata rhizophorae]
MCGGAVAVHSRVAAAARRPSIVAVDDITSPRARPWADVCFPRPLDLRAPLSVSPRSRLVLAAGCAIATLAPRHHRRHQRCATAHTLPAPAPRSVIIIITITHHYCPTEPPSQKTGSPTPPSLPPSFLSHHAAGWHLGQSPHSVKSRETPRCHPPKPTSPPPSRLFPSSSPASRARPSSAGRAARLWRAGGCRCCLFPARRASLSVEGVGRTGEVDERLSECLTDWSDGCSGVALCVGGPMLVSYVTPTEEELFKKYSPELQKRSLENRDRVAQEFDDYVTKLKEYSKSDKPIWVVQAEELKKDRKMAEQVARQKRESVAAEMIREKAEIKRQIHEAVE